MIVGVAMPLTVVETPSSFAESDGPEPIPGRAFIPLDDTIGYPTAGSKNNIT